MAFEHKNMSGSLFKNTRKQKESHPDYTGKAKINNVLYEIAGWKKGQGDKTFLSLSLKESRAGDGYSGEDFGG